ncbi:unnamed protein product [Amoebophrya sp. A25]|nr:unnamed protein product [Amoebophrya sp. A25]|eukprot:GSA25T00004105001.1
MSAERPPQQLETVPSSSSSTGVGVDRAQPLASDDADGGDSMHTARSDQNFSSAASASSSSLSSSKVNGLPPTKRPRTTINKIRIREEALQATGLDDLSGAARNFYGGHSGHLHWLEGTRVLAFAGNYYPDRVGGATPKSLPFIYEIDVSTSPARIVETINYARREVGENGNEDAPGPGQEQGRGRSAQSGGPRPGGSASSPRPGSQGWPHGEPHPQIMGAASAVWRRRVVFFGGGSPIDVNKINNDVTSFSIETKQWESFFRASVHAASNRHCIPGESFPRPRQGQRATVFQDRLFVFGGRESTIGRRRRAQREDGQEEEEDDGCRNDLWSFDLVQAQEYGETSTRRTTGTGSCSSTTGTTSASSMHASSSSASASLWKREEASGQVPPSRVWHASCDSTNGRWLVCAGSRWNFDKPEDERETHQFRQLFCLHLAERRWEEIRTQSIPPWVTAGCLVATGREILLFGGCKPQEVGPGGIRWQALTDESEETGWRSWYSHVGRDAFVFDAHERNWSPCVCEVSCDTQALWRSHFSAVFVPPTNQIFLFGGSRYFCGEYFHDLLVLDLPSAAGRHLPDRNASGVLFPGYVWNRWKGVLGRLRGLHATGDLDDDRMREVFQHLRQINREEDEESQEDEGAQEDVGPPERAPEADDNVNDVMEDAEDGVDEDESSDDGGDQAP